MEAAQRYSSELPVMARNKRTWLAVVLGGGLILTLFGCFSQWRYRIRATSLGNKSTEVSVEAVVEATPDSSTLTRLTSGTLDMLSVPFGSWISSAATGSDSSRLALPSRGRLEREFFAGLAKRLPGQKGKRSKKT